MSERFLSCIYSKQHIWKKSELSHCFFIWSQVSSFLEASVMLRRSEVVIWGYWLSYLLHMQIYFPSKKKSWTSMGNASHPCQYSMKLSLCPQSGQNYSHFNTCPPYTLQWMAQLKEFSAGTKYGFQLSGGLLYVRGDTSNFSVTLFDVHQHIYSWRQASKSSSGDLCFIPEG